MSVSGVPSASASTTTEGGGDAWQNAHAAPATGPPYVPTNGFGLDMYLLQQELQLRLVRLAAFIAAEDVDMRAGVRWLPRERFRSATTPRPPPASAVPPHLAGAARETFSSRPTPTSYAPGFSFSPRPSFPPSAARSATGTTAGLGTNASTSNGNNNDSNSKPGGGGGGGGGSSGGGNAAPTFAASDGTLLTQVLEHAEVQAISSLYGLPRALREAVAVAEAAAATSPSPAATPPLRRRASSVGSSAAADGHNEGGRSRPQQTSDGIGLVEEYSQLSVSLPALCVSAVPWCVWALLRVVCVLASVSAARLCNWLMFAVWGHTIRYIFLQRSQFTQVMDVVRRLLLAPIPATRLPKLPLLSDIGSAFNEAVAFAKRRSVRRGGPASTTGSTGGYASAALAALTTPAQRVVRLLGTPVRAAKGRGSAVSTPHSVGVGAGATGGAVSLLGARAAAAHAAAANGGSAAAPISTVSMVTKRVHNLLQARMRHPVATAQAERALMLASQQAEAEASQSVTGTGATHSSTETPGGVASSARRPMVLPGFGSADYEVLREPPKRIRVVEYDLGFLRWTMLGHERVRALVLALLVSRAAWLRACGGMTRWWRMAWFTQNTTSMPSAHTEAFVAVELHGLHGRHQWQPDASTNVAIDVAWIQLHDLTAQAPQEPFSSPQRRQHGEGFTGKLSRKERRAAERAKQKAAQHSFGYVDGMVLPNVTRAWLCYLFLCCGVFFWGGLACSAYVLD